jgi:hypothetical protein
MSAGGKIMKGTQIFLVLLVTSLLMITTGCRQHDVSALVAAPPRIIVIAVDESRSIMKEQRDEWEPMVNRIVDSLQPEDKLEVFGIGSQTANAAFFAKKYPPACLPNLTFEERALCIQEVIDFRLVATAAISAALAADQPSESTDIFSLLDRLHNGPGYSLKVFIFSDGLNDTQELNMERYRLTKSNYSSVITKISSKHRWPSNLLSGATVEFVAPDLKEKDKYPGVNDRTTLKAFYTELVSGLGGQLTGFDTRPVGDL